MLGGKKKKRKEGQEANKAQAADHLPGLRGGGCWSGSLSAIHLAADSLSSLHEQKVAVCEQRERVMHLSAHRPPRSLGKPPPFLAANSKHRYLE